MADDEWMKAENNLKKKKKKKKKRIPKDGGESEALTKKTVESPKVVVELAVKKKRKKSNGRVMTNQRSGGYALPSIYSLQAVHSSRAVSHSDRSVAPSVATRDSASTRFSHATYTSRVSAVSINTQEPVLDVDDPLLMDIQRKIEVSTSNNNPTPSHTQTDFGLDPPPPPDQSNDLSPITESHPTESWNDDEWIDVRDIEQNQRNNVHAPDKPAQPKVRGWVVVGLVLIVVIVLAVIIFVLFVFNDDNNITESEGRTSIASSAPFSATPIHFPSQSPSSEMPTLPDESVIDSIKRMIVEGSPESAPFLEISATPQSEALEWLLIWIGLDPVIEPSMEHILQRFSLITLYYSTGGDDWHRNQGWLRTNVDECDWEGIACGLGRSELGYRPITEIVLENNGLVGSIPNEVQLLITLSKYANDITCVIGR